MLSEPWNLDQHNITHSYMGQWFDIIFVEEIHLISSLTQENFYKVWHIIENKKMQIQNSCVLGQFMSALKW